MIVHTSYLTRDVTAGRKTWRRKLTNLLLLPVRFLQARHDLAQLAHLSDHQLKDMGITRLDLANAAALPFNEDPTEFLAQMRCERRKYSIRPHDDGETNWLRQRS